MVTLLAACGGDHARDWGRADTAAMISGRPPGTTNDVATALPADPAEPHEPPGELVLAADSAAGDGIFHRRGRCFTCHGSAGEGMARLGPSLRDDRWLHSDGSLAGIQRTIADGIAAPRESPIAMPGFTRLLSAEELRQVAVYVYALSHPGSVIELDPGDELEHGLPPPEPVSP